MAPFLVGAATTWLQGAPEAGRELRHQLIPKRFLSFDLSRAWHSKLRLSHSEWQQMSSSSSLRNPESKLQSLTQLRWRVRAARP